MEKARSACWLFLTLLPILVSTAHAAGSLSVVSSSADHLYFLGNETRTWQSAQDFCTSNGGRLVDVLSDNTQSALQTMLLSNPAGAALSGVAWIGLKANGTSNDSSSYRWQSGQVPIYMDWLPYAPRPNPAHSTVDMSCVVLAYDGTFGWNNLDCSEQRYFICQADYSSSTCFDLSIVSSSPVLAYHPCPPYAHCLFGHRACCHDGFALSELSHTCVDINECLSSPCHDDATCNNTQGSFQCRCEPGFVGNGFDCEDVEHRCFLLDPTSCPGNLTCLTGTNGENVCGCAPGLIMQGASEVGDCIDLNECEINGTAVLCPSNSQCVNTHGSYECPCDVGYVTFVADINNEEASATCEDVNECSKSSNRTVACGLNAHCSNTVGSYRCLCDDGFSRQPPPGAACIDDDECKSSTHNCSTAHATCSNLPGTFECRCHDGYLGDGTECDDEDECATQQHTCHVTATCTNAAGSYVCSCASGMSGDGRTCSDVDECELSEGRSPSLCGPHSRCTNTVGSYMCSCVDGYHGDAYVNCTDVEECVTVSATATTTTADDNNDDGNDVVQCPINTACRNTDGSFRCACITGYREEKPIVDSDPLNTLCLDVDECSDGTHQCSDNAVCSNVPGSYSCKCGRGYNAFPEDDPRTCLDIDECSAEDVGQNKCAARDAHCVNLPGTYRCDCYPGNTYDDAAKRCIAIDLCVLERHNCTGPNVHCYPGNDTFTCRCDLLHEGDPTVGCTPVDRCKYDLQKCNVGTQRNEVCDMDFSTLQASCICSHGYRRSMTNHCVRIDPCVAGLHNCSLEFVCVTTPTEFECRCEHGYEVSEFPDRHCVKIDFCATGSHNCNETTEDCIDDGSSGFQCRCTSGYTNLNSASGRCVDVNECGMASPCSVNADCTNLAGSYRCTCRRGYEGSGVDCAEVDECQQGSHGCHRNAACNNTVGSFECACLAGYLGDGRECRENQCLTGSHSCHANADCSMTSTSFDCSCLKGFVGSGTLCTPLFPVPCPAETVDTVQGTFMWPLTYAATATVSQPCPFGHIDEELSTAGLTGVFMASQAVAQRTCVWDPATIQPVWLPADVSQCRFESAVSNDLYQLTGETVTETNALEIGHRVEEIATETNALDSIDVSLTSTLLERLANLQTTVSDAAKLEDTVVSAIDGILQNAATTAIADSQREKNSSARLLQTIEKLTARADLNGYTSRTLLRNDIQVSIADIPLSIEPGYRVGLNVLPAGLTSLSSTRAAPTTKSEPSPVAGGSFQLFVDKHEPAIGAASISIPSDVLLEIGDRPSARVSFSLFASDSLFPVLARGGRVTNNQSEEPERIIDSMVISASVPGQEVVNLPASKPVNIVLKQLGVAENISAGDLEPLCVFWDFGANDGLGDWSSNGCRVVLVNRTSSTVHCQCNHLTNFAILLVPKVPTSQRKGLTYLTLIGASISVFGCVLTFITLMLFRRFRQQIQLRIIMQISLALLCTLATLLSGATATGIRPICITVAALLQYFPLVMFCWTLVQIFHLHRIIVRVFTKEIDMFFTKAVLFAWGVPLLVVVATMCADVFEFTHYGNEEYCRLQGLSFYVGYFGPICFILFTTLMFFLRLLCVIIKPKPEQAMADLDDHKRNLKVAFSLITVLSLTWVFGVFTLAPGANIIFTYIFTGLNALQGFTIFVSHILLRPEIREAWLKMIRRDGLMTREEERQASLNNRERRSSQMQLQENITLSTVNALRSKRDSITPNSPQVSRRSSFDCGSLRYVMKSWHANPGHTSPQAIGGSSCSSGDTTPRTLRSTCTSTCTPSNCTIIENSFATSPPTGPRHQRPRLSVEQLI
eukprot:scpid7922/ scgid2430/ Latent-transforming growth factor beta-binding protein 4